MFFIRNKVKLDYNEYDAHPQLLGFTVDQELINKYGFKLVPLKPLLTIKMMLVVVQILNHVWVVGAHPGSPNLNLAPCR